MVCMQEWFEATPVGRGLIHLFLFLTIFSLLVANLPPSALRGALSAFPAAFVDTTTLAQRWGVFSPDPRNVSLDFRAELIFEDGTRKSWTPSRDLFLGALSFYRWRKWYEQATGEDTPDHLSRAAALWIARRHSSSRRAVTSVELVQLRREIHPPGSDRVARWQEVSYYLLELAPKETDE
jgi:hypothetical protein